jgi:hypothetical protein
MENPPMMEWFGVHLDIPIVGDVALSRMWGDKEEIDGDIITNPERWTQWLKDHDLLVPSHV